MTDQQQATEAVSRRPELQDYGHREDALWRSNWGVDLGTYIWASADTRG